MSVYDTPEWAAWLASIRECPEDDTRRLICADWLEDRNTEDSVWRADYIRKMIGDKLGRIEYGGWESGNPFGFDFGLDDNLSQRVILIAHRGFIESVSGPLATLVGGECGRCGGSGTDRRDLRLDMDCPACHGTGRTAGVLPDLVRREPVMTVEVVDREPDPIGDDVCWVKERAGLIDTGATLPDGVYDRLIGGHREAAGEEWFERYQLEDEWIIFPTREAARAALSTAALRWAVSQTPSEVSA